MGERPWSDSPEYRSFRSSVPLRKVAVDDDDPDKVMNDVGIYGRYVT